MGLLTGEDYVVLIDDGVSPLAAMLQATVEAAAGRPVNFIVNTHVHGDHVGANSHFADTGAVVFAHENIRARLLKDATEAGGPRGLPVVTFADGVSFHRNGLEARVVHFPTAHTDGDAAIQFAGANVLFTGDLLFHSLFPFIDLDSGGDVSGYIAAMEKLLSMANQDTVIVPGHGDITDRAGMSEDLAVLRDSRARVKALVDQGLTADEVVARNPLALYHDEYNWGFITTERMTRTLVRDLAESGSP
jgi:glyoxylase-like metal-dependent hydrolase (beta-lactamase superfamily II)